MAKILWIDDKAGGGTKDRLGFDALMYFVEKNGHQVEMASTVEQIEKTLIDIESYDLLILDIIMDPLSTSTKDTHQFGGFDALETLINTQSNIPIIILSVMSLQMIKDKAMRRGLDITKSEIKAVLRKGPILPMDLANLVEKHLLSRDHSLVGNIA